MITARTAGIIVVLALAVGGAMVIAPATARALTPGDPAPDCRLDGFDDHPARTLSSHRGEVVLVDFWASWCGSCVEAFDFLNELERDFGGRGLVVVAVNLDADRGAAIEFVRRNPATFVIAADARGDCPREFHVWGMPTSVLLDRQGVVRRVIQGVRPGEAKRLRALIEELVDEPAPLARVDR